MRKYGSVSYSFSCHNEKFQSKTSLHLPLCTANLGLTRIDKFFVAALYGLVDDTY